MVRVDSPTRQLVADTVSVGVVARGSDVRGSQSERRAGAQGGRGLAAARDSMTGDPHLGLRAVGAGKLGQAIDVIDGVRADTDDVVHEALLGRYLDVLLSSYSAIAAAEATFSESTPGAIGIRA